MGSIKKIKVVDPSTGTPTTYDVGQMNPNIADMFSVYSGTSSTKIGNVTWGYKKPTENSNVVIPGKINIEGNDDIQIKPGDDFVLTTSHKGWDKTTNTYLAKEQEELKMIISDASDKPCRLKTQASEFTWITDYTDATGAGANEIFNVNVRARKDGDTSGNKLAYLKLRARAIDLRCEEHGGIAIQPYGSDSDSHMNKVKFEHGGGDGLEFLTMNTSISSIFTDEYRFNKDGFVKMATRDTSLSSKYKGGEETTHYKYRKQADDFCDIIDSSSPVTTWGDIIKTSYAMNTAHGFHTHITSKGNLEIAAYDYYYWVTATAPSTEVDAPHQLIAGTDASVGYYNATTPEIYKVGDSYFTCAKTPSNNINIESAGNITIDSSNSIKMKGNFDFGSNFGFGELDGGVQFIEKNTKKQLKTCDKIQVYALNTSTSDWARPLYSKTLANGTDYKYITAAQTITPDTSVLVAEARMYDIIGLLDRVAELETKVAALITKYPLS